MQDGRLLSGDHILQIGDVSLRGMGSEQVAAVLRQSGTQVRLIVARPIEPSSPDYRGVSSSAPIVPTKILGDPEELDRHLAMHQQQQLQHQQQQQNHGGNVVIVDPFSSTATTIELDGDDSRFIFNPPLELQQSDVQLHVRYYCY